MPQVFRPSANTITRTVLVCLIGAVAAAFWVGISLSGSPYSTMEGVPREQPVPFSHQHHVGGLGLDCRYCHTTVENSKFANIPPTKICMNCHAELWATAPALAPVRESWRTGRPIAWTRVHDLPGFVYFDHSIHIQKGFGCVECHGRVDRMPLTWKAAPLTMQWCLDCHRNPEQRVMPRDEVFNIEWKPPPDRAVLGRQLVREYGIRSLTSCSTCHR
jgi:hypothetical protein